MGVPNIFYDFADLVVSLGRKIVQFKTSNSKRQFKIHEDLCNDSKFFKQRLQKARKDVDGECPICHEDLDPNKEDVTFCRASCGQNLHEECMEQWMQAQTVPPRCPLCRKFWKQKREEQITLDKELDPDAVQLYLDWLYTKRLVFPEDLDQKTEEFSLFLLKAWTVSETMQDADFRHRLVAKYVSTTEDSPELSIWTECVQYAFETQSSEMMRTFVVDAFLVDIEPGWFDASADFFPAIFTHALCRSILLSMKDKKKNQELLEKHTDGNHELEDFSDDDAEAGDEDEDESDDED